MGPLKTSFAFLVLVSHSYGACEPYFSAIRPPQQNHKENLEFVQVSEDLNFLARYFGATSDGALSFFAAALARGQEAPGRPVQLAVIGGAGVGKSTVASLLVGVPPTDSNPQAGHTRHPIAYLGERVIDPVDFPFQIGELKRVIDKMPADLDENVYQLRHDLSRKVDPLGRDVLSRYRVWDCPDITTFGSTNYLPRVMETAARADIIVYVASDERYNDSVPTDFLRLVLSTGKPVIVVLTKMKSENAQKLREHFWQAVGKQMPGRILEMVSFPETGQRDLQNPKSEALREYRESMVKLLSSIEGAELRDKNRTESKRFLKEVAQHLLTPVREELAVVEEWSALVREGQTELETLHYDNYVHGQEVPPFEYTLAKLLDLFKPSGIGGAVVENAQWLLAQPTQLIGSIFSKETAEPTKAPEKKALEEYVQAWLNGVYKESAVKSKEHRIWRLLADGLKSEGERQRILEMFEKGFHDYRLAFDVQSTQMAEQMYEGISSYPLAVSAIKTARLAIDCGGVCAGAVAIASGAGALGGLAAASPTAWLSTKMVEWVGDKFVNRYRAYALEMQRKLFIEHVTTPIAEYLNTRATTSIPDLNQLKEIEARLISSLE